MRSELHRPLRTGQWRCKPNYTAQVSRTKGTQQMKASKHSLEKKLYLVTAIPMKKLSQQRRCGQLARRNTGEYTHQRRRRRDNVLSLSSKLGCNCKSKRLVWKLQTTQRKTVKRSAQHQSA